MNRQSTIKEEINAALWLLLMRAALGYLKQLQLKRGKQEKVGKK